LLTPADAPVYRDIRLEGLKTNPEAFGSTFEREDAMPLSWHEERLIKGNVFGAFFDGELVGVAGYWVQEGEKVRHKAALWGMYVRPKARNAGLGRRLVQAIIDHASGLVELLQLRVESGNQPAQWLYQKMGFSEYGREMKALKQDGRYFDEILMMRFLADG
jgi:RimJ/RimL family protein N-acetyltransferase